MGRGRLQGAVPDDLSCFTLDSRGRELVLLSYSSEGRTRLTPAEVDIALAVTRGLTNAAIAKLRGSSPRTVANQLATMMRKFGVSSRVELVARFNALDLA